MMRPGDALADQLWAALDNGVVNESMKVSLRMILIEDDQGKGVNVRPLAQQEVAKFELEDPDKARELMVTLASAAQEALKPIMK